jgi:ABC exporter DevB family membrane fusion protein
MKWVAIVPLVAISGASLTFLLWRSTAGSPEPVPTSARAESHSTRAIEGIGYVEPASEVRLLSPKTGGVIKACHVKVGDVVHKGEPILTLHDEKEVAAVTLARWQLDVARAEEAQVRSGINHYHIRAAEKTVSRYQAEYDYAAQEATRSRRLVGNGAVSRSDMEAADTKRLQAAASLHQAEAELLYLKNYVRDVDEALMKAKVSQAEANLEVTEQQLRDLRVLAPFNGTVLKFLKRSGEGVRMIELEPVVIFGDLSRLRVRAEVDERFVKDLQVGQTAEVYGRNLHGQTYPGRLVEVEKIMGDKTVFTRASSERKDLLVLQAVLEMGPEFSAPVGMQVDVMVFK